MVGKDPGDQVDSASAARHAGCPEAARLSSHHCEGTRRTSIPSRSAQGEYTGNARDGYCRRPGRRPSRPGCCSPASLGVGFATDTAAAGCLLVTFGHLAAFSVGTTSCRPAARRPPAHCESRRPHQRRPARVPRQSHCRLGPWGRACCIQDEFGTGSRFTFWRPTPACWDASLRLPDPLDRSPFSSA